MADKLYQLGGFQKDIVTLPDGLDQPDHRRNEHGVQLVLGIRRNGASYLLIPGARFRKLKKASPPARGKSLTDFLSLSPINFSNRAELQRHMQNYVSNKKTKGSGPRDRSKANTSYTASGDNISEVGKARASFEHQRVLGQLLRGEVLDRDELNIEPVSWLNDVHIIAFTFNTWLADMRPLSERESDPTILDLGWTEFRSPSLNGKLTADASIHLVVRETRFLNNPGSKRLAFQAGTSETVDKSQIRERLEKVLLKSRDGGSPAHVLLLVHDEVKTMGLLKSLGMNVAEWTSGVFEMLHDNSRPNKSGPSMYSSRYTAGVSSRGSRARSPRRNGDGRSTRARSPRPNPSPATVNVVDVRHMYLTLRQRSPLNDSLRSNARDLGVTSELTDQGDGQNVEKGWCAGSESRLLGHMWHSMAKGSTIDDQRTLRWSPENSSMGMNAASNQPTPQPQVNADAEEDSEDDDDVDPNDIVQPAMPVHLGSGSQAPGQARNRVSLMDSWDDASDDDDDGWE